MTGGPIDPAVSVPVALAGRIVTMDAAGTVFEHGVLYARGGAIIDIRPPTATPPPGFADVVVTQTRGTLFPGLIELHNHLPYDVLKLWPVPRRYTNRDHWSGTSTPQYRQLISGPMRVLGADPDVVPAIVRYVETRALLGGTTTSQGVALAKAPGIISHFRGLVRNVETTHDPDLPPATTHIADIDATDADHFLARLSGRQKLILHLSEGIDTHAHDAFAALHLPDGRWAITDNLIGIHCLALTPADFAVFADHGGSMVWSPLSNLLLYGQTANVVAATAAGVPIALGSDWAPSGSKNALGELKIARLAAQVAGTAITDRALVAMLTTTPARMLGWDAHLGSLEPDKRADLIVVAGVSGDPYAHLVDATEADLKLVMINGVARVGTPALIDGLVPGLISPEPVTVAGRHRVLNLAQLTADPDVAALTVRESLTRLRAALRDLADPSPNAPARRAAEAVTKAAAAFTTGRALLAASQIVNNGMTPRPHLPLRGHLTGPNLSDLIPPALRDSVTIEAEGAAGLRQVAATADAIAALPLTNLGLDPLTAVDNPAYYIDLAANQNLPPEIRDGLTALGPT